MNAESNNYNIEAQKEELMIISSIYCDEIDCVNYEVDNDNDRLVIKGSIRIPIPKLENTIRIAYSSNYDEKEITIDYLSPVKLNFLLPDDYPSNSLPNYSVEAFWLESSLMERIHHRISEYKECSGLPVLFFWMKLIEEEVTSYFQRTPVISIDKLTEQGIEMVGLDLVKLFVEHNENAELKDFQRDFFCCEVCFEEKSGNSCLKFVPCKHIFCLQCVDTYYHERLKNFTAEPLRCLDTNCTSEANRKQLQQVLTEEELNRYEKLLLKLKPNVASCPRPFCGELVSINPIEGQMTGIASLGECMACGYCFCIFCNKTYHGIEPCKVNKDIRELYADFQNASEADREFLCKKYGRKRLFKMFEEVESDDWINSNSKRCPSCKSPIEKEEGCNKMHCVKCKKNFCWLCNSLLDSDDPYAHFNAKTGKCFSLLFEGVEDDDDDDLDYEEYQEY